LLILYLQVLEEPPVKAAPIAMLRGAEITVSQMFLKNLIPVTLGNIVGGSLRVMMPFGTTFGKWFDKKE
jgi:formate/nitrite transporter FocA (FNT family)